ncbi:hypothetical protein BKA70DRAFT_646795 [Coprinopsis sp. MPI-PUGE-AT-0042]|nr:hypothetical protein BKA70DRAFT_646795 [Coprinopsis sp. MPI-PUGE-AT-0042]
MTDTALTPVLMTTAPPAAIPIQGAPVLSFPAILRNPGLNSRYAHLTGETEPLKRSKTPKSSSAAIRKNRKENDGKRWVRRKDNAHFVGNPYIVAASRKDYGVPHPETKSTFPEPLPPFLPRTVRLPTHATPPPADPNSANAGRFSLSLKGMRKELRRQGGRAEGLVVDVERAIVSWLVDGGTLLAPDVVVGPNAPMGDGVPIGNSTSITEVSRTPVQLIWRIADDAFARYVVHCCARYHEIVSFSKGDDDNRLTYLLRPNVTRPDRRAPAGLDTPPTTDIDYSSVTDIETESNIDSDFVSDRDLDSDIEGSNANNNLDSISERSSNAPTSPQVSPTRTDDSWSLVGDADADVESSNEFDIEHGIESLTLSQSGEGEEDPDKTVEVNPATIRSLHRPYPLNATRRVIRSSSSPSRSPLRIRPAERRRTMANEPPRHLQGKRTFYEFIFR